MIDVKVLKYCICICMYYNVYVLYCIYVQGKVGQSFEYVLNMIL